MLCQNCKQHSATIHLTEISDGQRMEMHLCEGCAAKQGIAVQNQIPLNELLSSLLAVQAEPKSQSSAAAVADETACPTCGMTLKRFSKQSLLGCPNDYKVFDRALRPLIEKSHAGHSRHCGKVPTRAPRDLDRQIRLMGLRRRLDQAVRAENYETAAELKEQIERLQ